MVMLTALTAAVRFSADAACSVLATEAWDSLTSLRLGVELLFLLVSTLLCCTNKTCYNVTKQNKQPLPFSCYFFLMLCSFSH